MIALGQFLTERNTKEKKDIREQKHELVCFQLTTEYSSYRTSFQFVSTNFFCTTLSLSISLPARTNGQEEIDPE